MNPYDAPKAAAAKGEASAATHGAFIHWWIAGGFASIAIGSFAVRIFGGRPIWLVPMVLFAFAAVGLRQTREIANEARLLFGTFLIWSFLPLHLAGGLLMVPMGVPRREFFLGQTSPWLWWLFSIALLTATWLITFAYTRQNRHTDRCTLGWRFAFLSWLIQVGMVCLETFLVGR